MILYHGSNMEISEINLAKSRPYKDFGKAFYLSADKQQALSMARFKALTVGGEEKVTAFDFDENNVNNLKIKKFDGYNQEWADFVFNNRDERQNFQHNFDIAKRTIGEWIVEEEG